MNQLKFTLIYLVCFFCVSTAIGQSSYTVSKAVGEGKDFPFVFFRFPPGYNVIMESNNPLDTISEVQTIPFEFEFFGERYSQYRVSDNGYLTFDVTDTISNPNNVALPSGDAPLNAIFTFWDDLTLGDDGSSQQILSFTYGEAPQRTHVIGWAGVNNADFEGIFYAFVRLSECGDFDIIYPRSFGTQNSTGTVGCQNKDATIGVMAENLDFSMPFNNIPSDDDLVYEFKWDENQYDLGISDIKQSKFLVVGENTIEGTVVNNGRDFINSFDVYYAVDGGTEISQSISGLNIEPDGGTYDFTHDTPLSVTEGGVFQELCVRVDNINGNLQDSRDCNNTVCTNSYTHNNTPAATANVVIEEFTGTWCAFCTDGAVVKNDLINQFPDEVFGLAIHFLDVMNNDDGRAIIRQFDVNSYPSGMINRGIFNTNPNEVITRQNWEAFTVKELDRFVTVDLDLDYELNQDTRELTGTIKAHYADFDEGNMEFMIFVTEDSVVGGDNYNQANAYNNTQGHPMFGLGNPIEGYVHNYVMRATLPGVTGSISTTAIPRNVKPQDTYETTFSYSIPEEYRVEKMALIGVIIKSNSTTGQRQIMNSVRVPIEVATPSSVLVVDSPIQDMKLHPVPAIDDVTLTFSANQSATMSLSIVDVLGKNRLQQQSINTLQGVNKVTLNIHSLKAGLYYVLLRDENGNQIAQEALLVIK